MLVQNKSQVVRVTWQAENKQEPTTWYYHQRCYSKQRLPNMQLKRLPQETLSGEIFCNDCLGSLTLEGLYLYDLFKEPVPYYSWEEIMAAVARWKEKNAQAPTHVKTPYLESIERVNEALRQGAQIVLWTDTICLFATEEQLPDDATVRHQVQLKKIEVEFQVMGSHILSRVALRFWEKARQQELIWRAEQPFVAWGCVEEQARLCMLQRNEETSE